ncbi:MULTISPECIES: hypothetical protein [unclassified Microbacterium]|uniref:hypothetical protein n=1 Tax=unclassified Microbacterium TaxID=2609290 RepID=UPI0010F95D1A|nr:MULTISPECIES: hypothetical protein [unclassified Microbacterium]
MNTTLSPTSALANIRERFEAITQEQENLELERRRLLVEERDGWRADGIDAHIVSQPAGGPKLACKHLVDMREVLSDTSGRNEWKRDVRYTPIYVGQEPDQRWGPYANPYYLWIHRGTYVCVLADDESAIIISAAKTRPASGDQVARAASRIRNLARREHMRASIHDTRVTLTSPMNEVVHEGDIISAFLWLCGLDANTIEDRHQAYWEATNAKERAA